MADVVSQQLKVLHDQLLADAPAASHDTANCAQCTPTQEGLPVTPRSFTEDEVRAQVASAVDQAVGELRTELAAMQASQEAAAITERIAAAVEAAAAPLRTQVTELQTNLDAAVLEAAAEKARAEGLETAAAEALRLGEIASRRDARLAEVTAAAPGFDDAYLAANAERWAAMEDAEFATRIEEYKAASAGVPAGTTKGGGIPTTSALQATVMDKGAGGGGPKQSAVSALTALRRSGVDVRTL